MKKMLKKIKSLFRPSKLEQRYVNEINLIRRVNNQEQIARISELENFK